MNPRALLIFFAKVVVLQVLAYFLWLVLAQSYTKALCAYFDEVAGHYGADGHAEYLPQSDSAHTPDNIVVRAWNSQSKKQFSVPYGSGHGSYFPSVFMISLIVSTPLAWRRRLVLGLISYGVLQVVLVIRVALMGIKIFAFEGVLQTLHLSSPLPAIVDFCVSSLRIFWLLDRITFMSLLIFCCKSSML